MLIVEGHVVANCGRKDIRPQLEDDIAGHASREHLPYVVEHPGRRAHEADAESDERHCRCCRIRFQKPDSTGNHDGAERAHERVEGNHDRDERHPAAIGPEVARNPIQ